MFNVQLSFVTLSAYRHLITGYLYKAGANGELLVAVSSTDSNNACLQTGDNWCMIVEHLKSSLCARYCHACGLTLKHNLFRSYDG